MATVTKARKPKGKPVASAPVKKSAPSAPAPKAKSGGKASMKSAGTGKFATNQPPLDAMKDVDERIPVLTDECQRYLGLKDSQKTAKVDADTCAGKIGELLKKHDLQHYTVNGKKFYIEPGSPSVKCVNVKQNG